MPNWENVMIDTDQMEQGTFYTIETNKDNVTVLVPVSLQNKINAKVAELDLDVQALQNKDNNVELIVYDNQARIENIENADARFNLLAALKNTSIKYYFDDAIEVEISHNRDTIVSLNVFQEVSNTDVKKEYICVTSGVIWRKVDELINGVWKRKIVINSNNSITGYVEIL